MSTSTEVHLSETAAAAVFSGDKAASSSNATPGADNPSWDALLARIGQLAPHPNSEGGTPSDAAPDGNVRNDFLPIEPTSIREARLSDSDVEALVLKCLLNRGDLTGREMVEQIRLPFVLVDELLRHMKNEQLVTHRGAAPMNDYQYQLTALGRERARRLTEHCSYFGTAPVALADYIASVTAQSLGVQRPSARQLEHAFADLVLGREMLDRLGPAINSGRGLFLFGAPGNGKTSIAQRVTAAFGEHIWIPRVIGVDGEVIRLFDPVNHEEMPLPPGKGLLDQQKIDKRWVRVRRPTIIAGGELTMDALEVTINRSTGVSEAPLQMKSNCGTLVIDDFGRQRMRIEELLNRWIVPLEMRVDLLSLHNGKKITVPFDQLIIFSTNLEPRDLVDEAFLRRVPYKIEICDPSEQQFRDLFQRMSDKLGFPPRPEVIDYVLETHYHKPNRPLRFCQPRDLLMQVQNYCRYQERPLELTTEAFDLAVATYFAVM